MSISIDSFVTSVNLEVNETRPNSTVLLNGDHLKIVKVNDLTANLIVIKPDPNPDLTIRTDFDVECGCLTGNFGDKKITIYKMNSGVLFFEDMLNGGSGENGGGVGT